MRLHCSKLGVEAGRSDDWTPERCIAKQEEGIEISSYGASYETRAHTARRIVAAALLLVALAGNVGFGSVTAHLDGYRELSAR